MAAAQFSSSFLVSYFRSAIHGRKNLTKALQPRCFINGMPVEVPRHTPSGSFGQRNVMVYIAFGIFQRPKADENFYCSNCSFGCLFLNVREKVHEIWEAVCAPLIINCMFIAIDGNYLKMP